MTLAHAVCPLEGTGRSEVDSSCRRAVEWLAMFEGVLLAQT